MSMDARTMANKCGCRLKKCRNLKSGHQWCTTYSCHYDKLLERKKPEVSEVLFIPAAQVKPMIQEQREAQKIVMAKLKKRWDANLAEQAQNQRLSGRIEALKKPNCWLGAADDQFPNFQVFPDGSNRYGKNPESANHSATPSPDQPTCQPYSTDESCANVKRLPADIMEPRAILTQMDSWKGLCVPTTRPEFEQLVPAVERLSLLPSVDPFIYSHRLGKRPPERMHCLKDLPEKIRRHEIYGHENSICESTGSLGYRAQRKHLHDPPTFLWTPLPQGHAKPKEKEKEDDGCTPLVTPAQINVPVGKMRYRPPDDYQNFNSMCSRNRLLNTSEPLLNSCNTNILQ